MHCVRATLLTTLAAAMYGSGDIIPLALAEEESASAAYTKKEIAMMDAFNFCTKDKPITWIDKSPNTVAANVKAGAAKTDTKPAFGPDGKISDLASFVEERLKVLPDDDDGTTEINASNPLLNVATLIIENDCAYAEQPSHDCAFDLCK